jgi:hypothetical protein
MYSIRKCTALKDANCYEIYRTDILMSLRFQKYFLITINLLIGKNVTDKESNKVLKEYLICMCIRFNILIGHSEHLDNYSLSED